MYVGVEVIAGDSIIAYGLALGLPVEQAKWFTTFTLFAMVGTYALGGPHFLASAAIDRIHTRPDEHYRQQIIGRR